ncbi:hypothetical protein BGX27_011056, partial [Mortierella sp. AM989]
MPLLVHAIPLNKTWTGVRYWRTSELEDLPLELEFKHRSQKLLRAWTAEDAAGYAIQWKLRERPMNVAKFWYRGRQRRRRNNNDQARNGRVSNGHHEYQNAGTVLTHVPIDQTHGSGNTPSLVHNEPEPQQQEGQRDNTDQQRELPSSIPTIAEPSLVANVNQIIRYNPQLQGAAINDSTTGTTSFAEGTAAEPTDATTETPLSGTTPPQPSTRHDTPTIPNTLNSAAGERSQPTFLRRYLMDCLQGPSQLSYSLGFRKVWLIEISVRDCQLDDYTLTVPSPVYCDYRLPGYEDAMMTGDSSGSLSAFGARLGASSSRLALNRYTGEPPPYQSDTDDESDDEAEDEDDDDDNINSRERGTVNNDTVARLPTEESGSGSQQVQEMTMVQRPTEMTSIV